MPRFCRQLALYLASTITLCLVTVAASPQAALLLEQPYGVFGTVNPTGHAAIYLKRVCADTPVHLRLCRPQEDGVVISRYKGMDNYDWIAIPLVPYLYSVDDPTKVPAEVNEDYVARVRTHYKEARLGDWGENLPKGNFFYDGWVELVGTAYDRRTYAFRFNTTQAQDERLIKRLNSAPNRSHFNILFNNCADFDRHILSNYFPGKFRRNIFPDAGITTPKRIAWTLVKYSRKHPDTQLTVLEIPQVPGYRHKSRSDRGVAETLFTNGYIIPVVFLNPYVAGALLVDYAIQGSYHLIPKDPPTADPTQLNLLTDLNPPSKSSLPGESGLGQRTDAAAPASRKNPDVNPPLNPSPLSKPAETPLTPGQQELDNPVNPQI